MEFDFGKNWHHFSLAALNSKKVEQAKKDFKTLAAGIEMKGKSFLDVGFGQGLTLLTAAEMGAHAVGCDLNPRCREVLRYNQKHFFKNLSGAPIQVQIGSILDDTILRMIRRQGRNHEESYDVVHSWGVLHHTGDMKKAIRNTAALVKKRGYLILALYNRHWSSYFWKWIKQGYCRSPKQIQNVLIMLFYPVIHVSKRIVTGKNPKDMDRGMDFYFNVIDWVGGYPYEYASIREVESFMIGLGFKPVRTVPAKVPTGCNEFVFQNRN
jgi:2-polyprenyl-6-hydroxyphenyl methylase/3-demethylubiquinone-9 3-methyltransferase